jgi:hypothetical protein
MEGGWCGFGHEICSASFSAVVLFVIIISGSGVEAG